MEAKVRFGIILLIVVIIIAAVAAAVLMGGEDEENGNGGPSEVVAEAGPDLVGQVGVPIDLNATASTGKIAEYWWDMDRGNVSEPLSRDAEGSITNYTYEEPGAYEVTLVCEGKDGTNDTDTLMAYIDLIDTREGTLTSPGTMNDTYMWSVDQDINRVLLKLTFPTKTSDIQLIPNNVDLYVYAGGTSSIVSTATQLPDPDAAEQEKTLDVPTGQLVTNGGFTIVVQLEAFGVQDPSVAYTLEVQLIYHFE